MRFRTGATNTLETMNYANASYDFLPYHMASVGNTDHREL